MECHGSIGSVRPSSSVDTASRREKVDAHVQTPDVQRGRARSCHRARYDDRRALGLFWQPPIPSHTTRDRVERRRLLEVSWSSSVNEAQVSTQKGSSLLMTFARSELREF